MRDADTAMYHAKAKGRARFEVFDESMRQRATARLGIETDLRRAMSTSQLVLYYQPEISLVNLKVTGYEALVRWNHPERGFLVPDEFIPVAEESDLIIRLGEWVLREACRQMAEWHESFVFDPPLSISVNVSPRQLSAPGFVEDVENILAETGLDPRSLKLEMTESSIMANPEITLATVLRLKALNVGLEMDDFGTGYSSLSYLQRFPFDTVKIDRSFISESNNSAESAEIIRTIVELARSLKMKVVAEGVETGAQLQKLTAIGCNFAQGYYFSKPLGAEHTMALIQARSEMQQAFSRLLDEAEDSFSDSANPETSWKPAGRLRHSSAPVVQRRSTGEKQPGEMMKRHLPVSLYQSSRIGIHAGVVVRNGVRERLASVT